MKQIKEKYKLNRRENYRLQTVEDLLKIYNMNKEKIRRYKNFNGNKKELFERFLVKFFNGWA